MALLKTVRAVLRVYQHATSPTTLTLNWVEFLSNPGDPIEIRPRFTRSIRERSLTSHEDTTEREREKESRAPS